MRHELPLKEFVHAPVVSLHESVVHVRMSSQVSGLPHVPFGWQIPQVTEFPSLQRARACQSRAASSWSSSFSLLSCSMANIARVSLCAFPDRSFVSSSGLGVTVVRANKKAAGAVPRRPEESFCSKSYVMDTGVRRGPGLRFMAWAEIGDHLPASTVHTANGVRRATSPA